MGGIFIKHLKKFLLVCVLMIVFNSSIFSAEACTNAYFSWTWNNSVDSYALTVNNYSTDFYNQISASDCVFVWNNISSNIRISSYTYGGMGNIEEDYSGDINLYSSDLPGDILGITDLYKNLVGSYVPVSPMSGEKIIHARIQLDTSLLNEQSGWKNCTIIHEIGHALALRHPIEVNCTSRCVMQQASSSYVTTTIATHDQNNLRAKWGD